MGRRPVTTTRRGRAMNPVDQQRKSLRQKELKKNRQQRNKVREEIIKNRDIDQIIEALNRLDEQEFDIDVEHYSKYVIRGKRIKNMQAFNQLKKFYQTQKLDEKLKEVEQKMEGYLRERTRKMQQYNALRFSLDSDPVEIPLPEGSSVPTVAMTPSGTPIPSICLIQQARPGILKYPKPVSENADSRREPPGPPVGLPPRLEVDFKREVFEHSRKVRFAEGKDQLMGRKSKDCDDNEPDDMPTILIEGSGSEVGSSSIMQSSLVTGSSRTFSMLPSSLRLPIRVPPPPPDLPLLEVLLPPSAQSNAGESVISGAPVMRRPKTLDGGSTAVEGAIVSAKPALRDLMREATKFVPVVLRSKRHKTQPKLLNTRYSAMGVQVESAKQRQAKDTDKAYEQFMSEISALL